MLHKSNKLTVHIIPYGFPYQLLLHFVSLSVRCSLKCLRQSLIVHFEAVVSQLLQPDAKGRLVRVSASRWNQTNDIDWFTPE